MLKKSVSRASRSAIATAPGGLDHDPDLDVGIVGITFFVELAAHLLEQGARRAHFLETRDHRVHDLELAGHRGAQEGAQLGAKNIVARQQEADAAPAEEGVQLAGPRSQVARELVAADVEGAEDDRLGCHLLQDPRVGFHLLVLGGQVAAGQEEVFGAVQTDAARAFGDRQAGVVGRLDVRRQLDLAPVEGDRREFLQGQELALELDVTLLGLLVILQRSVRRPQHHDAHVAVDDDRIAVMRLLGEAVEADDRRDAVAARQDRGVRGASAQIRGDAEHEAAVDHRGVGWQQIVRDDHRFLVQGPEAARLLAGQVAQQSAAHVLDVGTAFLEIRIADAVEGFEDAADDAVERELGAHELGAHHSLGVLDRLGVLEDEEMRVEDLGVIVPHLIGETLLRGADLVAGARQGGSEALDLGIDLRGIDHEVGDDDFLGPAHVGLADDDARRHRDAAQAHFWGHAVRLHSPKRPSTSATSASIASFSSGAVGADEKRRAHGRTQRHEPEDALAVDRCHGRRPDPDQRRELRRGAHEHAGGA
jgi:hypothetical protein